VIYGGEQLVQWLQRDFGLFVVGLLDLSFAFPRDNIHPLALIIKRYFKCVELLLLDVTSDAHMPLL